MSIRSGQITTVAGGFVLDRLQTVGPSSLKIPQEVISEVGDPQTVAVIRDTPDLGFDMESFDMSCQEEAVICGLNPNTLSANQAFNFTNALPLDVVSPFKSSLTNFGAYNGVVSPFLTLQQADYKFSLKQNATQSFKFVGDALFYTPGAPRFQRTTLTATTVYPFTAGLAAPYVSNTTTVFALSVTLKNPTTGAFLRLFQGLDYTDGPGSVTLNVAPNLGLYTVIDITYSAIANQADNYPQSSNLPNSLTKPGAVRSKDIDLYVSNGSATPIYTWFSGVQSTNITWKVTLNADQEFGNAYNVSQDYDFAEVSGQVAIKPTNPADLNAKIDQIAQVTNAVAGALTGTPIGVILQISDPQSGLPLKTLYVPDALFNIPPFSAKVKTKQTFTLPFQSQGGLLTVFNGTMPGATLVPAGLS